MPGLLTAAGEESKIEGLHWVYAKIQPHGGLSSGTKERYLSTKTAKQAANATN